MVSNSYIYKDKYNSKQLRNKDNTPNREFNCGGWALNCFSWYRPTLSETFCNWGNDYEKMSDKEMFEITLLSVEAMLKEFSDLRVIRNLWELKKDEYAIAFRVGQDVNDFHYCKRSRNGHWTHKMGGGCIKPIKKKDVFAPYWNNEYCGHLVLFAKKLPKKDLEKCEKPLTIQQTCDIILL